MRVRVEDMLKLKMLEGTVLLGGKEWVSNEIEGITIIEAPDIVKFIKGGEVLLTGLYAFMNCTMDEFKSYIDVLDEKKICAMGIKRGRNIDCEEEKIKYLVDFAERNHFPIFEVPFKVSFIEVMNAVMERLTNEEVMQLKYFKTTHDNFSALSFPFDSTKNGVGVILDVLSKLINNPVSLFSQNMTMMDTTDPSIQTFQMSEKANKFSPGFYSTYTYLKQKATIGVNSQEEYNQYLVHLKIMYNSKVYLVVTETEKELGDMDFIAIENACTALKHELFRRHSIEMMEKKYESDILNDILYGKIQSPHELKKNAKMIGLDSDASYFVLVCALEKEGTGKLEEHSEKIRCSNILYDAVLNYFPKTKTQNEINKIIMIQPVSTDYDDIKLRDKIKESIKKIQSKINTKDTGLKLLVGVGKEAKGIENIPESLRQAMDSLGFVKVLGQKVGDSEAVAMFYDELGIFEFLCRVKDVDQLEKYIPQSLQRLISYKRPQKEYLLDTLKIYLDHNQNLAKTAQDLYIHYKTASYRVERIAEITGIDFDNPNEVLAVRIGLIVYKTIKNFKQY